MATKSSAPRGQKYRVGRKRRVAVPTDIEAAVSAAIELAVLELTRRGESIFCDGQHRRNDRWLISLINSADDSEIEVKPPDSA
jgi:hypothetical protein